jgi:hypothetical protein
MVGADMIYKDNFYWRKRIIYTEAIKYKTMARYGIGPPVSYNEKEGKLYSEVLGQDLSNLTRISESKLKIYLKEVDRLQKKLIDLGVAHTDIKPQNLIYTDDQLYVIDWDHAVFFGEKRVVHTPNMNDGTTYMNLKHDYKCGRNTDSKGWDNVRTLLKKLPSAFNLNKNVNLIGDCSYKNIDGKMQIKIEKISNKRQGKSGTIEIALWATSKPYNSGGIDGYKLLKFTLDPLEKGYCYNNIERNLYFTAPPKGIYYTTLTCSEWYGEDYKINDAINFLNNFKSVENTGNHVCFKGTGEYSASGGKVTIKVDKIAYKGSGTSGTIRVRLVAMSKKYDWDSKNIFYPLASFTLEPLKSGNYYPDINQRVEYKSAPNGTDYKVLLLEYYDGTVYRPAHYIAF